MPSASALELCADDLNPESVNAAAAAARALARFSSAPRVKISVEGDSAPSDVVLPADIFAQIIDLLSKIANGHAVSIVPVDAELTTQQAAHYLNVSRPHIIKLIERGELSHRMVGTHRKLPVREVLAYGNRSQLAQEEALRGISLLEEELGLDPFEQFERD
jgi:excisionase family DNA binding protein